MRASLNSRRVGPQIEDDARQGRAGVADQPRARGRPQGGGIGGREAAGGVEVAGLVRGDQLGRVGEEAELERRDVRQRTAGGRCRRRAGERIAARGSQVASLHPLGRDERLEGGLARVPRHQPVWAAADRLQTERVGRQLVGRDPFEEVGRGDRLGRRDQEAADRVRQLHPDRPIVDGGHRDVAPRRRPRSRVGRVLEHMDGEHDVVGRDWRVIVPAGVLAEGEGVDRPGRVDGPVLGQVRDQRLAGAEADEAREHEVDHRAVGAGARPERAHRGRPADHPLAVGTGRRQGGGRRRRRRGGRARSSARRRHRRGRRARGAGRRRRPGRVRSAWIGHSDGRSPEGGREGLVRARDLAQAVVVVEPGRTTRGRTGRTAPRARS